MRPSRCVAGLIAGICGAVVCVVYFVTEGEAVLHSQENLHIILAVPYGLFWLADRLGLLDDPYTKATSIYDKKPMGR